MTILLVDPDPADRERIRGLLREEITEAMIDSDGTDLEDALARPDLRLVLIEQRLGPTTGLHVLERLRQQRPDVAAIMVTGHGDEETAVAGLKAGLRDYVPKHRLERLLPAVRQALAPQAPGVVAGLSPRGQRLEKVAHDLNNALTPIRLGADLLRRLRDEKARRTVIDSILTAVHRAVALLREVPEAAPAQEADPPGAGTREPVILLAEDEQGIRDLARDALESNGYRVLTAANGAEALALYEQHRERIAVVVVDLTMPVLDGFALMRTLRAINPSVLLLPASGLPPDPTTLHELGLRAFLLKPYTDHQLLDVLYALLGPA
jgi:CheY-like chemotaxis protein